ncbi:MAG TPA: hypothetical protein VFX22_07165, partial [Candidatus Kapabacteria bacterium]|nr:hypothetical protein [Candidatus Kapabacteria bacterium]
DLELLSGTAEISGAFLPPQSVSQNIVPSNFSILTTENAVHGFFDRCSKPRSLELYTPIGAKAASIEIAPGQSEISIPHLPSGLYFAQLGSAVLKVAIP